MFVPMGRANTLYIILPALLAQFLPKTRSAEIVHGIFQGLIC